MGLDLDKAAPKGDGAPGEGEEITLAMSDAGSRVLSRIKDDVADGIVSLRDAVELIYRAMCEARSSERLAFASRSRFREQ